MGKNQCINSSIGEEVVEIRRYLHKYPELSEQEYNTCKYKIGRASCRERV